MPLPFTPVNSLLFSKFVQVGSQLLISLSSVQGLGQGFVPPVQSTRTDREQMLSNTQVKMNSWCYKTEIAHWKVRFYFILFLEHQGVERCKHLYIAILIFSNANKHCLCSPKTASSSHCAKLYLWCSLWWWNQRCSWSYFPNSKRLLWKRLCSFPAAHMQWNPVRQWGTAFPFFWLPLCLMHLRC